MTAAREVYRAHPNPADIDEASSGRDDETIWKDD